MSHPYAEYESSTEWEVVSSAMEHLAKNGDVVMRTAPEYVIGYIVRQLKDSSAPPRLRGENE